MVQTTVNIYEAKTHLSRMVDRAAEGEEIIISRNGRPVARLCQLEPRKRNTVQFGLAEGPDFEVPDDFDAPLPDDLLRPVRGAANEGSSSTRMCFSGRFFDSPKLSRGGVGSGDRRCGRGLRERGVHVGGWPSRRCLGKLPVECERSWLATLDASGFLELYVTAEHAAFVAKLPHHHGDPFDRLLVAQAMTEPLVLITADASLAQYTDLVRVV